MKSLLRAMLFSGLGLVFITATVTLGAEEEKPPGPPWELEQKLNDIGHFYPFEEGFANLRIEGNTWRLYFADQERRIIKPPPVHPVIQWEGLNNPNIRGTVPLTSLGAQPGYGHPRVLAPPHLFRVKLVFMKPDGESIAHDFPFVVFRQIPED